MFERPVETAIKTGQYRLAETTIDEKRQWGCTRASSFIETMSA
jgi:hypothetical protein